MFFRLMAAALFLAFPTFSYANCTTNPQLPQCSVSQHQATAPNVGPAQGITTTPPDPLPPTIIANPTSPSPQIRLPQLPTITVRPRETQVVYRRTCRTPQLLCSFDTERQLRSGTACRCRGQDGVIE